MIKNKNLLPKFNTKVTVFYMQTEKIKELILALIEQMGEGVQDRANTGEAVLYIAPDIYASLDANGTIEPLGKYGKGVYFDGKFGKTFIVVRPILEPKKYTKKTIPIVPEQRRKDICVRYVNRFGKSVNDFESIETDIKEMLNTMPYYTLVQPLIISDHKKGGCSVGALSVRYGVNPKQVSKWLKK